MFKNSSLISYPYAVVTSVFQGKFSSCTQNNKKYCMNMYLESKIQYTVEHGLTRYLQASEFPLINSVFFHLWLEIRMLGCVYQMWLLWWRRSPSVGMLQQPIKWGNIYVTWHVWWTLSQDSALPPLAAKKGYAETFIFLKLEGFVRTKSFQKI